MYEKDIITMVKGEIQQELICFTEVTNWSNKMCP